MPARGDHAARRADVSEALWRVLASKGFGGVTLRAVAAEMGVSTGLLTHYFPDKRALLRHAIDVAERRNAERDRLVPERAGLGALRTALLNVLPLTDELTVMSRVWVGFWDGALADPELGANQQARYLRWRGVLAGHIATAQAQGELPADVEPADGAVMAAAFAHGLVVQALFDPARFPPQRQVELVDQFLATQAGG